VKEQLVYCGVDIAKSYLDAAIGKEKRRLANDGSGHQEFIKWIKQIDSEAQVICEPSGGYERRFIEALV
jgi:transposase